MMALVQNGEGLLAAGAHAGDEPFVGSQLEQVPREREAHRSDGATWRCSWPLAASMTIIDASGPLDEQFLIYR